MIIAYVKNSVLFDMIWATILLIICQQIPVIKNSTRAFVDFAIFFFGYFFVPSLLLEFHQVTPKRSYGRYRWLFHDGIRMSWLIIL